MSSTMQENTAMLENGMQEAGSAKGSGNPSYPVEAEIAGIHRRPGGSAEEVTEICKGLCRKTEESLWMRLQTEESISGEKGSAAASTEPSILTIILRRKPLCAEVIRRSPAYSEMIFAPGERRETLYRTPAGALAIGITTEELSVEDTGEKGAVRIRYRMDSGADREILAESEIRIRFRRLEKKEVMEKRDLPVGVFDSGFGGISVLREIVKQLPGEDVLFYGDSANAPYGTRSIEEVQQLTLNCVEEMRKKGIKALVVACNTATSAAISLLRSTYTDMPVIGIEPAIKPASRIGEHPRVLVLATPATIEGEKFHRLSSFVGQEAEIIPAGCPGLMEFVERLELSGPGLDDYLEKLLSPYRESGVDAVVLGCTHYPFLKDAISHAIGEEIPIFDGSEGTARELGRRLKEAGLQNRREKGGKVEFCMSLPGREELCRKLLEM